MFLFFSLFTLITCQEVSDYHHHATNIVKREQVPINKLHKKPLDSHLHYRRTKDIRERDITGKRNVIPFGTIRNEDKISALDHSHALYDRTQKQIVDKKADKWINKKREEIWDRKKLIARKKEEELNMQKMDTMNNEEEEMSDRRFEQSERELNRLSEAQDTLQELHDQLHWVTINTEDIVDEIGN